MALVVKDRVQETSATTGTGTLTLSGAVTGFQTFSSAIGNTNTTYYTIQGGSEWEVGIGTVGAGTLSRDTVLESSNSGSLVNFSAGSKFVFCTYPAEKSVDSETAQTLTNKTISGANNTITNVSLTTGVTGVLPEANGGTGTSAGNQMFKNRIINGAMQIDQRNAGASQTLSSAYTYTVDRWFTYSFGASCTGQRVASGITGIPNVYQITGAASVTNVQFMQRIEAKNISDCAGSTVTLSAMMSNSLLTSVTWGVYYANAEDNWTSSTLISSGTWTLNSTLTSNNAQISLPANAANGVWIVFTIGAQTSGTWKIGQVQLEKGSTATSFDYRPYGTELALCQRYYELSYSQGTAIATSTIAGSTLGVGGSVNDIAVSGVFKVTKRASPTVTLYSPATGTSGAVRNYNTGADVTSSLVETGDSQFRVYKTSGFTSGSFYGFQWTSSAEL
jgi:hypothetical protein